MTQTRRCSMRPPRVVRLALASFFSGRGPRGAGGEPQGILPSCGKSPRGFRACPPYFVSLLAGLLQAR
eukprot:2060723-Pyramimonas_sp.AAC.1